jgi:hypothetical protein
MLAGRALVLEMLGDDKYGYNHAHYFNDVLSTRASWITCIFTGLLYAFMFGYMLINFADTFAWVVLVFMQFFLAGIAWLCFIFFNNSQAAINGTVES